MRLLCIFEGWGKIEEISMGGGEKGIRTLDTTLWSYAPLAGEYLQPLGHLSAAEFDGGYYHG